MQKLRLKQRLFESVNPKRYGFYTRASDGSSQFHEVSDGAYVHWEDYERLRSHSKNDLFRETPPLKMDGLSAAVHDADGFSGFNMLVIAECENGKPKEENNVYVLVDEAVALRDWLNKVLS